MVTVGAVALIDKNRAQMMVLGGQQYVKQRQKTQEYLARLNGRGLQIAANDARRVMVEAHSLYEAGIAQKDPFLIDEALVLLEDWNAAYEWQLARDEWEEDECGGIGCV
jgi:hypothetical protein